MLVYSPVTSQPTKDGSHPLVRSLVKDSIARLLVIGTLPDDDTAALPAMPITVSYYDGTLEGPYDAIYVATLEDLAPLLDADVKSLTKLVYTSSDEKLSYAIKLIRWRSVRPSTWSVNRAIPSSLLPLLHALAAYADQQLTYLLTPEHPRIPYANYGVTPPSKHIGQRKLLLNELYLFTQVLHPLDNVTIVYVGAAPGYHLEASLWLFPNVKWILYDGRKLQLPVNDRVTFHQRYFTMDDARSYAGKNVVFVSDIRRTGAEGGVAEHHAAIEEDMRLQESWVKAMKPRLSMLKFRLPYGGVTSYRYLAGDILLQPYAKPDSTETRLIVKDSVGQRTYNPAIYEEQLSYHNMITRPLTNYDVVIEEELCRRWIVLSKSKMILRISQRQQWQQFKQDTDQYLRGAYR